MKQLRRAFRVGRVSVLTLQLWLKGQVIGHSKAVSPGSPESAITTNTPAAGVERTMILPTGEEVQIRPVAPNDAGALAASFARLSAQSRFQRFFTAMPSGQPADHRCRGPAVHLA